MAPSNLIFLISPPRSGSSMLQQLISSNYQVHSLPEPWFMLSLIDLFKKEEKNSFLGFNKNAAIINRERYFKNIPKGEENFKKRIIKLALETYGDSFMNIENKRYFLDKTPRYYHIISELMNWFPHSKIILLSRNPISVFCSIMDYNFKGKLKWLKREDRQHDIFSSHKEIAKFKNHPRIKFVRYEDIVKDPKSKLVEIFDFIGLAIDENEQLGTYELSENFKDSISVDTKSIHKHDKPVEDYLHGWKSSINNYQKKMVLIQYLQKLGDSTMSDLGYSMTDTMKELNSIKVRRTFFNKSLDHYMNKKGF